MGHLVQTRSNLSVLSAEFHRILGRLPSLGFGYAGISSAKHIIARAGGVVIVAGAETVGGTRRLAGRGDLRPASGECDERGVDDGTEKYAGRGIRSGGGVGLPPLCGLGSL